MTLLASGLLWSSSALAQNASAGNVWLLCYKVGAGGGIAKPFEIGRDRSERDAVLKQFRASFSDDDDRHYQCDQYDSEAAAVRWANGRSSMTRLAWTPNLAVQSVVKSFSLDFEPGDGSGFRHARRGYKRASIKLNYRFLLCANEIQVAYALDRKSLEHSQDYVDRFVGTNPNFITPPGEPPVPMTVPLALKVYLKKPGSPYVATLRDGTAGEALGMGCFTGQTSKIGLVAKLIGPKATRPEIKSYLDLLDLSGMTTAAEIDAPLLNPAVPAPPAAPRPPVRRKAK